MRDSSGNYAKDVAMYISDLYNAKVFYDDPVDFKKFGNEIIFLDSKKGLELVTKEIEGLNMVIPEEERRLNDKKVGRERLIEGCPAVSDYISKHNKSLHPLIGISNWKKKSIIKDVAKEHNLSD